ncbi:hypothetical protein GZH53_19410 [Flavihumibacter sp. R14]|nr:hypothetical protein [Flavihumibacter soli]
MAPLLVLLAAFLIALIAIRYFRKEHDLPQAARIGMSVMLLFTAIGHFAFTEGMAMMLPGFIPWKIEIVYFTGAVEMAAAIGLQIPSLQKLTAWLLILFFIMILPANINAAINEVDFQEGTYEGSGVNYLWFRVPLQVLFIAWTYYSAIRMEGLKAGGVKAER